ncbi:STAS domain-containing protein [Streptomyces sp. NPDC058330]|uniref:STAS domain-containing protein n=1 Tax=Streptomyces sp. NPDC058330 TaxID=3346449 RepID=UPI0036E4B1DC
MAADELSVVTRTTDDGVVLIRVRGSLDAWSGCSELADALADAAGRSTGRTVVDLSGVEFADSAGLHALLSGRQRHEETGGRLVLAGPLGVSVRRLFEVTGTLGAFRFADHVDTAFG